MRRRMANALAALVFVSSARYDSNMSATAVHESAIMERLIFSPEKAEAIVSLAFGAKTKSGCAS